MKRWSRDALLASFAASGFGNPAQLAAARGGLEELMAFLDQAIAAHRESPRDNIISALVRQESRGKLTTEEVRHFCGLLLIAGIIMVATLWLSKKSRTVSKTEVTLARQDEGIERFGSTPLSRVIVRTVVSQFAVVRKILPSGLRRVIANRLDPQIGGPASQVRGETASFDLLRASVNLIVASAVVSFATSMKLPLSTTYVTFMVSMGSSFSDQAWGRETAVYRVSGVMTVIGGWFMTALTAFTVAFIFAGIIFYLKVVGVVHDCIYIGSNISRFQQDK